MSMNLIQFQHGLSLAEFLRQYGSEAQCRRAFYRARWPKGFRCSACGDRRRSSFRRGAQTIYQCRACQHQSTLISGTLLQDTKLPLRSAKPSTRAATSPKPPTVSTVVFVCKKWPRDLRTPSWPASLVPSRRCAWRAIFFTEIRR